MATKIITVFFTVNGVPQTGLTPTIDIWEVSPDSLVINDDPLVEIGQGWYRYNYTSYDYVKSYVFTVDGGVALTACERYKVGGNESFVEDISYEVWEEPALDHTTLGANPTMGGYMNLIKAVLVNRTRIDVGTATLTVYDNDCITPLLVFDLKDSAGNPSVVEVCERTPDFC